MFRVTQTIVLQRCKVLKFWIEITECLLLQSALSAQNNAIWLWISCDGEWIRSIAPSSCLLPKKIGYAFGKQHGIASKIFQTQSSSGLRIATLEEVGIQFMLFTCIDIARISVWRDVMKSDTETSRVIENHCKTLILVPPHVFDYCCFVMFLTFFLMFLFMPNFVCLIAYTMSSCETSFDTAQSESAVNISQTGFVPNSQYKTQTVKIR